MKTPIKTITIICVLLLTINIIPILNVRSEQPHTKILYVDDNGNQEYTSIEEAIKNASNGDTIYIYNGTYPGGIWINKSIKLIGKNKENTTIEGIRLNPYSTCVLGISADDVTIKDLTIKNGTIPSFKKNFTNTPPADFYYYGIGIEIQSNNNLITNCNIINNEGYAIKLNNSNHNTIKNNNIINNTWISIILRNSSNNIIIKNNILNNRNGILIDSTSNNNILYYNNFINNTYYNANDYGKNTWYSTKLYVCNYWSDYNGTDENRNGIGDTPYTIPGTGNQDNYPLISSYKEIKFEVNLDTLYFMLLVSMIAAILFILLIGVIWYYKNRKKLK
ncbi:MAG: hypothetical protein DRN24_00125 [Thermoplasmata archaeon]|nr:MAG: hypothetical protein DRN24_00125 [Thermoplasmata archaeon]